MSTDGKILLLEDDSLLAGQIVRECAEYGLDLEHVSDGEEGFDRAMQRDYLLLVLDIKLPKKDGLEICREVRRAKPLLPIILLTSRTKAIDQYLGFEFGADDYITKPFRMEDLIARIRAKLRMVIALRKELSSAGAEADEPIAIGELVLDPAMRTLKKAGVEVSLTPKEYELLLFFMRNKGRVYSRSAILQAVWQAVGEQFEEAVVTMVRRLRAKIGDDPAAPRYLRTSRGIGYSFNDPEEPAAAP